MKRGKNLYIKNNGSSADLPSWIPAEGIKRTIAFFSFIQLFLSLEGMTIHPAGHLALLISPPEGSYLERFSNPPLIILEGFQKELLIWRGAYFEVFSENGKPLRRVGGLGNGPGEFNLILRAFRSEGHYYILGLPNLLTVLNDNFGFEKRFYLGGTNSSNIIFDVGAGSDSIVTAQRWRLSLKQENPAGDDVLSIYEKNGKFIRSFFSQKEGWNKYPDESLLGGHLLIKGDSIYFAYNSLNRIWKLDLLGHVLKDASLEPHWWHSISFDPKAKNKLIKGNGSIRRFYEDTWETGDQIYGISSYKMYVLIHVLREVNGEPQTYIIVMDQALEKQSEPLFLDKYSLSGVGDDRLYFTRYLSEYSIKEPTEIDILKCVLTD